MLWEDADENWASFDKSELIKLGHVCGDLTVGEQGPEANKCPGAMGLRSKRSVQGSVPLIILCAGVSGHRPARHNEGQADAFAA